MTGAVRRGPPGADNGLLVHLGAVSSRSWVRLVCKISSNCTFVTSLYIHPTSIQNVLK